MNLPAEVLSLVERRAEERCEYRRMHQSLQGATFHVEHIVPRSRGGESGLGNFAWCCPSCNLRKSNRVAAIDPATGTTVRLFHPRRDNWKEHFGWNEYEITGHTPVGRATVLLLEMNHFRRVQIRKRQNRHSVYSLRELRFIAKTATISSDARRCCIRTGTPATPGMELVQCHRHRRKSVGDQ